MSTVSISKLSELLEVSRKLDRILVDSKYFDVESRGFALKSLEGVMEYSVVALPRIGLKDGHNVSFEKMSLRKISVISSPGFSDQGASISTAQGSLTKSFVLNPKRLDDNAKEFNFRFEVECDIEPITKDLVRRDHQIETSSDENNTYWLSAELKELGRIVPLLKRMDLSDIPFVLNVAVHQDIKTKFPIRRQKELELIAKWAHESDRNKKKMLSFEHLRMKRERPKEKDITKILIDLQTIFTPHQFCSYIDVLEDFYYADCFRGTDFYDQIPFRTFPKWMSVVCRTDVSTEKPASEGELVYKKAKFKEAVEDAITEK